MIRTNATTMTVVVLLVAAALAVPTGSAEAQRGQYPIVSCIGGTLTPPAVTSDLHVTNSCTVPGGTYKFHNVNIYVGGTLTFTDATIDFWAASILVGKGGSLFAGTDAPIGTHGGTLTIHLWGPDQTCPASDPTCAATPPTEGKGIICLSDAVGQCGVSNDDWTDTPTRPTTSPVGVTDYFYRYHPLPRVGGTDPLTGQQGYYGYKVLAVGYGGTLQLFGKQGATYGTTGECGELAPTTSGTSWARLAGTAKAGATSLTVDRKLFLKDGNQIVVTTTDYLPGHSEQLTVVGDVACGTTINVKRTDDSKPLKYDHNGTRYSLAAVPPTFGLDTALQSAGAETRAAVALLTRSIRIVSAGDNETDDFPAESTGYMFGGHMIARQGFSKFQVQGVEFYQMGQGGRIGHYPIHFHMARKTPPGTFVKDSSIWDSMTRWIVLHGTQNVTLERNVGYKSIGHGFYLEDGTEINNTLTANLGIFARAAVDNAQNPRKVPGILAAPDLTDPKLHRDPKTGNILPVGESVPYQSDYDHPTAFWIMNGWNDFTDNMAAGAGMCGVCYWYVPGYNSTMSQEQTWESYASMQSTKDRAGTTPLKSFVGNSCTSAMTSFQSVLNTTACFGLGTPESDPSFPTVSPIINPLAPYSTAPEAAHYYPNVVDAGHKPTQCGSGTPGDTTDCKSSPGVCSEGTPGACVPTILDHYTTSFNWAAFNFAAIWLRPQWYLVTDSVITDVQGAGLSMVTGGGYDASSIIPGQWALVRKSVFIGHTQDDNPLASNGGPFNPLPSPAYPADGPPPAPGLRCAMNSNGDRPGSYCLSISEGVSHPVENFAMYQRLFSLYDGPALQDSNAYLNIKKLTMSDCAPFPPPSDPTFGHELAGRCDPKTGPNPINGRQSAWRAGYVTGLPREIPDVNDRTKDYCYMPNAAIGWKQPNGFYYPPANHSANLFFDGVDIRHFVVSPLFKEGTLTTDTDRVRKDYCVWGDTLFNGFAGNDRQTVLNDDDGTLTGYKKTTAINLDPFFFAPVDAVQCLSDGSSRTSPYEYVTTVVYPECARDKSCAQQTQKEATDPPPNDGDWNRACTNQNCYGVPLYRQDLMPKSDEGVARSIRMMGQEIGQRSSLTVNNGTYYVDTTVGSVKQRNDCPGGAGQCAINVFKENGSYYLFLIYAKESTEQTYRFYVGENTSFDPASIELVQADIRTVPVTFPSISKPKVARWFTNNKATAKGVVEVVFGLSDVPDLTTKIKRAKEAKCQPTKYCTWDPNGNSGAGACNDLSPRPNEPIDAVCRWAIADLDCPDGGCVGIEFKLPSGFKTDPGTDPRPAAVCLPRKIDGHSTPWDVSLDARKVSDGVCPAEADKLLDDFCP